MPQAPALLVTPGTPRRTLPTRGSGSARRAGASGRLPAAGRGGLRPAAVMAVLLLAIAVPDVFAAAGGALAAADAGRQGVEVGRHRGARAAQSGKDRMRAAAGNAGYGGRLVALDGSGQNADGRHSAHPSDPPHGKSPFFPEGDRPVFRAARGRRTRPWGQSPKMCAPKIAVAAPARVADGLEGESFSRISRGGPRWP